MKTDGQKGRISLKDLPSPRGHFLFGHLPEFRKHANKHQVLERWVAECGKLFRVHFAGIPLIISADPVINQQVLALRPEKFRRLSKMSAVIREMGVSGVFNTEGDTWKRHRVPVASALNVRKIRAFYPVLCAKTQQLLDKFGRYAAAGQVVSVQKEFMAYTVDITTSIAFGYEMDTIGARANTFQKHLETIFPMINARIAAPVPLWRFFKTRKDRELEAALKAIEKTIHQFIREAKDRLAADPALREHPTNLLERLLVEDEDNNFTDEEIYGNVFTMLLAGEDTTSNSISWAVYFLAQHPEMVRKVREEANAVYGEAVVPPDNQHLSQLTYTNAVAQETLRIKPTTPQLYMEAKEDVVIEDLFIAKNTRIILQNKVAQTAEAHFTNGEAFLPERWLKEKPAHLENHDPEMIKTFGGGPRFCPGKYLATNEIVLLLSALCKQFDLELAVDPQEVTEQFEFTMYPGNLLVRFTPV
ncbi:MAG: cytochrome P450 [Bacteroidetes bacterium]|nr:MAG: cytochrome P450 [Bacteroidota bacterium]